MSGDQEKNVLTRDDIAKIAPHYRGKPENFDPAKVSKKKAPMPKRTQGPKGPGVTPPTNLNQGTPTPQKNESMLSEAIFGPDVYVTEIHAAETFSASYAKLIPLAAEVHSQYATDERQLDRVIVKEELMYYATALLWLKLLSVKDKQKFTSLTSVEKDLLKSVADTVFNVPQPIYEYLSQIGSYNDKMGKETFLNVPPIPNTVIQNRGGYHAAAINQNNHSMFEEIPSLGIAGDVLMAVCSQEEEPVVNIPLGRPAGSAFNFGNLLGTVPFIGVRRPEIRARLSSFGITPNTFTEYSVGTRFNIKYLMSISNTIGRFTTYRVDKVCFKMLTAAGGETQVIRSRNQEYEANVKWTDASVIVTSAATSSTAIIGAGYIFGFQLEKGRANDTQAEGIARASQWSCLVNDPGAEAPWVMPEAWYNGRNSRRIIPEGVGTERFRSIAKRQDIQLSEVSQRMVRSPR